MQKSWEEYASAEYKSSITYAELAQSHIDRALEIHSNTQSETSEDLSIPSSNEQQESIKESDNSTEQLDQTETSEQEK